MNAIESLRPEPAANDRLDEEDKRKAREGFVACRFHHWSNSASAQGRGPFVGGDDISVADLKLFVALRSYASGVDDHIPAAVLDSFSKLTSFPKLTRLAAADAAHTRVVDCSDNART